MKERKSVWEISSTLAHSEVHNLSYGLIVEGPYDEAVFRELVRRLSSPDEIIFVRPCGGASKLMRQFPAYLQSFEYIQQGRPVDKALVIRDSNGKDPVELEQRMAEKIRSRSFSFPHEVKFYVVRREMETWLLSDADAINSVAVARQGRRVASVQGTLEDIQNPKERLIRLLSKARLPYDSEVCREIVSQVGIERLSYRCPSFATFAERVKDC